QFKVNTGHPIPCTSGQPLSLQESFKVKFSIFNKGHNINGSKVTQSIRIQENFNTRINAFKVGTTLRCRFSVQETRFPFILQNRELPFNLLPRRFFTIVNGVIRHEPMLFIRIFPKILFRQNSFFVILVDQSNFRSPTDSSNNDSFPNDVTNIQNMDWAEFSINRTRSETITINYIVNFLKHRHESFRTRC